MQSVSVFLDITKLANFWLKNANISRIQGVCHMIYIFVDPLWVRCNCAKFHHCKMYVTDVLPFCPPSVSSPEKVHPE